MKKDMSMPSGRRIARGNRKPRIVGQPPSGGGCTMGPVHYHGGNITPSAKGHTQPGMKVHGGNITPT